MGIEYFQQQRQEFLAKKAEKKARRRKKLIAAAQNSPEIMAAVATELLSRGFLNEALARNKRTRSAKDFYKSAEWRSVRYGALIASGGRCACCGATPSDGAVLHVDHKKPRSKFPELALELSNLQVLCDLCNVAKSNIDMTDWTEPKAEVSNSDYREYKEEERRIFRLVREIAADKK